MSAWRADGVVLVAVLLLTLLMSAFGVALALITSSDAMIAANFRDGQETRYAASAVAERTIAEVAAMSDWNGLLDGSVRSTFFRSAPSGPQLADGSVLDVQELVSLANCQKKTACTSAEMDAVTADRPWGVNNPRWQLVSQGWLRDLLPAGSIDSAVFTVVFVGDDPLETDGNPLRDEPSPGAGAGTLAIRALAFGPRGARQTVEVTVVRGRDGDTRPIAWRDRR